jgi:hypothetical protein
MIGSIAAAVALGIFLVRRRKIAKANKKLKVPGGNNGQDKRENIEDILENPTNDPKEGKGHRPATGT